MLVSLPDQTGSVVPPGEVLAEVKVPEAGNHFYSCSSDVHGRTEGVYSPERPQSSSSR